MNNLLIALLVVYTAFVANPASAKVSVTVDENTGIKNLTTDGIPVGNDLMVGMTCSMSPYGKGAGAVSTVEIYFMNDSASKGKNKKHPEWRNAVAIAKIYTAYKQMEGPMTFFKVKGKGTDYLRLVMRASDFVHMTHCDKARITSGKWAFNLRKDSLIGMAEISDIITGAVDEPTP